MNAFRSILALGTVGALLYWGPALSKGVAPEDGAIRGRVVDGTGSAVAWASVVLRDKSGVIVRRGESGILGDYLFEACAEGSYKLAAMKPGVGAAERFISIKAHASADGALRLSPDFKAAVHR